MLEKACRRIMGLLPRKEVKNEKRYKAKNGDIITIQAGKTGWSIVYPDGAADWRDSDNPTEINFKFAYDRATERLGELAEVKK